MNLGIIYAVLAYTVRMAIHLDDVKVFSRYLKYEIRKNRSIPGGLMNASPLPDMIT